MPLARAAAASPLRAWHGIDALVAGNCLWLSGRELDPGIEELLRGLPGGTRFDWCSGDRLAPAGRLLSDRPLPQGD